MFSFLLDKYLVGVYNKNEIIQKQRKNFMKKCECCSQKTKHRSETEYKSLINRLNRIEGQIRGIKRMVESDSYCTDILMQVSAANAALNAFSRNLLYTHIRTCVADDIKNGDGETIEELISTLQKLMK